VGARDDDVVHAAAAAIAVLQGGAAAPPFSIKDEREALLLLIHYVGDMHQPLHIGAVYLDPAGKVVNPDAGGYDPATETRGGNRLVVNGSKSNLHATWDVIPVQLAADQVTKKWLDEARATPRTPGPVAAWPPAWATDTQKQADKALAVLKFGARSDANPTWSTTLSSAYATSMTAAKRTQLTKAGARLAQLLQKIWPAD
jgi:hypothetical protein